MEFQRYFPQLSSIGKYSSEIIVHSSHSSRVKNERHLVTISLSPIYFLRHRDRWVGVNQRHLVVDFFCQPYIQSANSKKQGFQQFCRENISDGIQCSHHAVSKKVSSRLSGILFSTLSPLIVFGTHEYCKSSVFRAVSSEV